MTLLVPSRRRFLLGAGAVVASAAIVRATSLMPISVLMPPKIWGDGWHDDSAALQQLIDKHALKDAPFAFPQGTYLLGKGLRFPAGNDLVVRNCTFIAGAPMDTVLYFAGGTHRVLVTGNIVDTRRQADHTVRLLPDLFA